MLSTDAPDRKGYYFLGWATERDAETAQYFLGDYYTDNASVTLYAIWTPKEAPYVILSPSVVNLDINDANYAVVHYYYFGDTVYGYGVSAYIEDTEIVDWTWNNDETFTIVGLRPGHTQLIVSLIEDVTGNCLDTAICYITVSGESYTIHYDANGGACPPGNQTKIQNVELILSSDEPVRDPETTGSYSVTLDANGGSVTPTILTSARTTNYCFINWNTNQNGSGRSYAPGATYTENADMTLYAQWNSSTLTAAVTLPTPTREGYSFKGWATSSAASSGVTGSYTPSGNVTLYAIWEEEPPVQTDALIVAGTVTGRSGSTVDLPISLENNPGIISMMLHVSYDSSVMSLTGVTDAGKLGTQYHNTDYTLNPYILSWADDTATENNCYNGVIVTLHFQIREDASEGTYPVTISYNKDNAEIYNSDFEPVFFNLEQGAVTVQNVLIGDVNGDGRVNGMDRTFLARHVAQWNGYSAQDIVYAAADVNSDGKVNGMDRTVLARHVAQWPGYGELPYRPNNANEIRLVPNDGSAPATITASSATVGAGESVEITLALENNPGIISMLLRVGYDSSALELTGISDAGALGTQYHNTDYTRNPYILSWADDTATENNTYNGRIVTLIFRVREGTAAGTYPVTLSYDENEPDIYNSAFEPVHFELKAGSVNVQDQTGFRVTVTDRTNGAASASIDPNALYDGELSFTVSSTNDSAVLVTVKSGDAYTVLLCTTDEAGLHHFTLNVTEATELALIFRGDADGNGKVNMRDSLAIKKHTAGTELLSGLFLLSSNADGDSSGRVNMRDSLAIKKDTAGTEKIKW